MDAHAAPEVSCLLMQTRGSARMCQGTFFVTVMIQDGHRPSWSIGIRIEKFRIGGPHVIVYSDSRK